VIPSSINCIELNLLGYQIRIRKTELGWKPGYRLHGQDGFVELSEKPDPKLAMCVIISCLKVSHAVQQLEFLFQEWLAGSKLRQVEYDRLKKSLYARPPFDTSWLNDDHYPD
jgi:hypothetical protein